MLRVWGYFVFSLVLCVQLLAEPKTQPQPPRTFFQNGREYYNTPYGRQLAYVHALEREAAMYKAKADAAIPDAIRALGELNSLLTAAYTAEINNLEAIQVLIKKGEKAESALNDAIKKGDRDDVFKAYRAFHHQETVIVLATTRTIEKTQLVTVEKELRKTMDAFAPGFLERAAKFKRLLALEEIKTLPTAKQMLSLYNPELLEKQIAQILKENKITRDEFNTFIDKLDPVVRRAIIARITSLEDYKKVLTKENMELIASAAKDAEKPLSEQSEKLQLEAMEKAITLMDGSFYFSAVTTGEASDAFKKVASNMGGAYFQILRAHVMRSAARK